MNPLGQMLLAGRYQVLEKLGQGGMGEVYKGLDTQTERFVAIKQLRGAISDDKTVIERFRREGQALSDLNHPNIVKMLDMIQQDKEYFLVTEFLGGGDLANMLRERGKLSLNEALKMGLELADALSRAHHLGIIHRDIKPANVLIADDGTPRLTDFGVAHMASQERLTGTGMAVGTMDYLPPEAVNGEAVDVRADVWSFGVMLYEMLTGERPFQGNTTMQLLSNILTNAAPDIRERCPEASAELNELVQQMLQKERNQRIRSARQVGAALEAILEGDESGLRRLQTPSSSTAKLEPLADSPTTPGIPIRPREAQTTAVKAKSRVWLLWLLPVIVVLGIVLADLGYAALVPNATAMPSPTPEPTATPEPILGDAPAGYRWEQLDELAFLVPEASVDVPTETVLAMNGGVNSSGALQDLLAQQRSYVTFVNWVTVSGMTVMIEDSPVALPDDINIERYQTLAEQGGSLPIEELAFLDLPFGRTLYFSDVLPAPEGSDVESRLVVYATTLGTRIYTFAFVGQDEDFASRTEEIQTVIASAHLEEVVAAATEAAAPEGYEWKTVDELRMLVPDAWINMPIETFLELSANITGDEASLSTVVDYLNMQNEVAIYGSFIDFTSVAIMVEDSGVVLPDEVLIQRIEQIKDTIEVDIDFTTPFEVRETHLGTGLFASIVMLLGDEAQREWELEVYIIYQGTKLYTIGFSSLSNDDEANRVIYETIFNSIEIGDDEAEIILPNMPEGWQVAAGERTAYAVPMGHIITSGSNQVMLNATLNLVMGNSEGGGDLAEFFDELDIDVVTANLQGDDLLFTSSIYQESALSMDVTAASEVVQSIFATIAQNEELQYTLLETEEIVLPAGISQRTDARLEIPERPAFRSVYYVIMTDEGHKLYSIAFSFLDSEAERMLPVTEQIAQTFVILED